MQICMYEIVQCAVKTQNTLTVNVLSLYNQQTRGMNKSKAHN